MPGALALGLTLGVSVLALLALFGWRDTGADWSVLNDQWFWRVVRFSLWQALLSAGLSVAFAIPVARAFALDSSLPGRQWFLRWCLLCFVMPSLVLITGMVVLFGRSGLLTPWLGSAWNLYGLSGILLAHVFLNLPFAVRVFSFQWQAIPDTAWKVAVQFNLTAWQRFKLVEWPALRGVLPATFGFIFLLCFNSFAVVLALGGGPRGTTIEVAIYQALKYNFNPSEALMLAATQLIVAGGLFAVFSRLGRLTWLAPASNTAGWLPAYRGVQRWLGRVAYMLCCCFLLAPIAALIPVALRAQLSALPWVDLSRGMAYSLAFAGGSALLAVCLALGMLAVWRHQVGKWRRRLVESAALHHLVIPGMVLSVGLYIFFMPIINWRQWGWVAIVVLNAMIALPFVFSQLKPGMFDYDANYRRLSADLGLCGWALWGRVVLPFLWPALQRALAISFVLALGDFAVFGIFGADQWRTLPWLIYALSGSYRLAEAALASLLLLALSFVALTFLEKQRRYARE
ncbi:ABC transporter permease subunit [Salinispirillum sp. LH 10-3-1]|uniref:ABC transporter permease subunit n=1 Tax=Salinispirillum sp. LH 10-3-1 TaxID=2952525 RepID=A0AB38YDJ2_9GAMM